MAVRGIFKLRESHMCRPIKYWYLVIHLILVTLSLCAISAGVAAADSVPLPKFYGVYAVVGDKLVELKRNPQSDSYGTPIGGGDVIVSLSGISFQNSDLKFIIFSPQVANLGATQIFVNIMARVRNWQQPGYHILDKGWPFRIAPVPNQPQMIQLVHDGKMGGGHLALLWNGFYDFEIQTPPDPQNSCVVRQVSLIMGGVIYKPCSGSESPPSRSGMETQQSAVGSPLAQGKSGNRSKIVRFTCSTKDYTGTFDVNYDDHTVSASMGEVGKALNAKIDGPIISWHAHERLNYGGGGFADQDMKLDTAAYSLTNHHSDSRGGHGTSVFQCDGGTALDPGGVTPDQATDINVVLNQGIAHARNGDYNEAVKDFDRAMMLDPKSADALNDRCFARATAGMALDRALADCNESLRLRPRDPSTLGSRALVNLKLQRLDAAIADYDAALEAGTPYKALSLYGRGVAEHLRGNPIRGDKDIAAAKAIDQNIVKEAENYHFPAP